MVSKNGPITATSIIESVPTESVDKTPKQQVLSSLDCKFVSKHLILLLSPDWSVVEFDINCSKASAQKDVRL